MMACDKVDGVVSARMMLLRPFSAFAAAAEPLMERALPGRRELGPALGGGDVDGAPDRKAASLSGPLTCLADSLLDCEVYDEMIENGEKDDQ